MLTINNRLKCSKFWQARRRQKAKTHRFVKAYFAAWHEQIKNAKALKARVLNEWMQYAATVTFRYVCALAISDFVSHASFWHRPGRSTHGESTCGR